MSTHKEYALIAILVTATVVGVIPAFAANNPYLACPDCNDTSTTTQQTPNIPIVVTTDKDVYDHNSDIMISGHVIHPYPGQDVTVKVQSPQGNIVFTSQVSVDNNGDFSTKLSTQGTLLAENGQYTVYAQQGNEQGKSNAAVFQLTGEVMPAIPEFGPIAALVLVIAIVSIIAISKTGLRLMPKY